MKKITFFITVLLTGFAINLSAQNSSEGSISATVNAKLIKAMTLTESTQLNFGSNLLPNASGGTVVLPSNSTARTYDGNGGVVAAAVGPAVNGAYAVTGTAGESYALTLPTASFDVTHTTVNSGVNTMTVTSMLARFNNAGGDATTSTLAQDGTDSFTLGATLTVGNGQKAGIYAGTFPISVDYN
jgi:hypothetical protein